MKKRSKKRWLRKYDGKKYGWFLQARDLAIALIAMFLLFNVFVGVSKVSGNSMHPTLRNGQDVFFTRINFSYDRDQVVFARMPAGTNYVKRIVAIPGDVVDIRDGILYVNGEPEQTTKAVGTTLPEEGIVEYPYTVPEDCWFLVGRWLIPHQANERIMKAVAQRLPMEEERVFMNIGKYGNTSAASIGICIDEMKRSGQVNPGDYVLLTAFGGGLTWGAILIKW